MAPTNQSTPTVAAALAAALTADEQSALSGLPESEETPGQPPPATNPPTASPADEPPGVWHSSSAPEPPTIEKLAARLEALTHGVEGLAGEFDEATRDGEHAAATFRAEIANLKFVLAQLCRLNSIDPDQQAPVKLCPSPAMIDAIAQQPRPDEL